MKLNKKTKTIITAAIVAGAGAVIVELWRGWPWLKKLVGTPDNKTNA